MSHRHRRFAVAVVALALAACGNRHGHDDDHGHAGGDGLPGQSVTRWSEHHELFMEYAPLVVGQDSRFAAHVTELPGFAPVASGTVIVTAELAGGGALTGRSDAPDPPGIFRPAVRPDRAGACRLVVTIERAGARDIIDGGACEVFADEAAALARLGGDEDPPGRISYLKEQAWKSEFASQFVAERDLQPGVRASGEIRPVAGLEARLSSPTPGQVTLADPPPVPGMAVKKGQLLAMIAPRLSGGGDRATLDADVAAARAELDSAAAQEQRAQRLLADDAIPERQLEEARSRVRVARARLSAATGRLGQYAAGAAGGGGRRGGFQIRSPMDGTLTALAVASGQSVIEGEAIATVMNLERVYLQVQIFEPDIPRVDGARAAWFTIDGYDEPFQVDQRNGRLVTLGQVLDPQTRTVPLIFELANPGGKLRIGQFARVVIATGAPVRALAVPESAIVDDAGTEVVYIQVEGEAFERKPVTLGLRAAGWVQVVDGLKAGQRVVTRGAYDIKLASAAGAIPAHGHAH